MEFIMKEKKNGERNSKFFFQKQRKLTANFKRRKDA